MEQELEQLQGQIERITFTSEETGYTVAKVRVYGRRDLVTVIGNIVNPTPGEIIKMKGEWGNHPKYGEQFKIVFCQTAVPANVQGIEKYLGSGLIKGIGPVMAKRVVKMFKEKTLEIIESEIERLAEVEGIGQKRIAMIRRAWEEQKEIREVMIFLQSHGVSSGYAAKIYKQYGNEAVKIVQENPYRLATDVFGIGFITADKIAEKMGFARDSELRAAAGILYVLHELTDEGHVFYPYDRLLVKCEEMLDIDREIIVRALDTLAADKQVVVEEIVQDSTEVRESDKAVYLTGYHIAEKNIAFRLMALVNAPQAIRKIDAEKAVQWVQERLSITLADKQIEAVHRTAANKVMVITGGPGTGKTTIINAILRIFSAIRTRFMLAAPTGRAAKRMSEATGHEAKTIHRMLEYNMRKGGFQKNEGSPLNCELLIVDEASMIDTLLMHHLLKAVPVTATFILVGDVNQLPSVGAGNVLKDIIDSGTVPVVRLNEIFRQARESSIIVNAHKINEGVMPSFDSSPGRLDDFYFISQEDPQKALETVVTLVKERIPKRFGFDPIDDIQVLTPMHKGTVGAGNLNIELQKALNPGTEGVIRGGRLFRVNDKVMQIVNNYDKDVYNGDIGRIISIDTEAQEVRVAFDGREVGYDYTDLDELVHAYAVSVHKSQGSEYPAVVVPILTQHYVLLQRNLLYTAVTRGKKLVVLVGTKKALAIAVKNNRTRNRYTLLERRLRSHTQ
ncbi:MAG TPA: ATP-dependent RecD-like DNA helicase [Syntrophales bacterium]|nr:ATP-dependent RecD-like DNA helicase [Syntrophales bacterium]HRT70119.1 ATP-dependent RecD-like DNA helicase [Syntrophales bacterium]